jgi:DNA-binding CsgD family transcriptional regulator
MLQPLGISAKAEALYVVLAPLSAASLPQLSELTRSPIEVVEENVHSLHALGLAVEISDGLWRALPLSDVVRALRAQRMSELEMASLAAESLQNHLLAASQTHTDDVRIVVGRESIVAVNREMCGAAKTEICVFDKPPYVENLGGTEEELADEAPEWQALERGVSMRSIYHPGFDDDRLKELIMFAAQGEQSRTAPVPMKLIIVDSQEALIPSMPSYVEGHETRASVVRHPLIVESLQWLFDAVWDTAIPIVAGKTLENDPRRQMLISLLMSGSTDNAIANQLGINVRSVRRWIAELMDDLGVNTRLQLGAALVRAEHFRYGDPAQAVS